MNEKEMDVMNDYIQNYGDMIYRISLHYMKQRADAEDVTQDVFIKLIKKHQCFENKQLEKAWVIRVTINTCKDYYRYLKIRRAFSLDEHFDQKQQETKTYGLLYEVAKLPLKYRSVIYLFYYEQYDIKEIAAILQKKEATITTWLYRARKSLKQQLKEGDDYV